jgi:prephenate dehydrogenase
MSDNRKAVLIIGGRGEFGRFLQSDILPSLGVEMVLTLERDTPREQHLEKLKRARHVVLSTPLAGYAERACSLVQDCRDLQETTTLWLISSVQAEVWRTVATTLTAVGNPYLAAVFAHPMYGPNGFRAKERESETFRNILTATVDGSQHAVAEEIATVKKMFHRKLSIETTTANGPEEHDQATAHSQGLSYCVAQLMFEHPEIDAQVKEQLPDLHLSFHANRSLIGDFLRLNAYMPEVFAVFKESWLRTKQANYIDVLEAFRTADLAFSGNAETSIPTKWYKKLRSASRSLSEA